MTIEDGMNKLAKVLGNSATFNITVAVWNERGSDYHEGDNRVVYKVWNAALNDIYEAKTVAKAVAAAIEGHRAKQKIRVGEQQSPDEALKEVA